MEPTVSSAPCQQPDINFCLLRVYIHKPTTYLKGYKPEVTDPQHTKVEIFKGKVKNKITLNLCSRKIH
jgi:3-deoxy-D-arabino-heptulosonate 7-phosphate (DAHP) synthase